MKRVGYYVAHMKAPHYGGDSGDISSMFKSEDEARRFAREHVKGTPLGIYHIHSRGARRDLVTTVYPQETKAATSPTRHHATKRSPSQLQREIDEVLNGSSRPSHATASTTASDWAAGGHARKKKITPQEARRLLESDGVDFSKDFFQLGSSDVGRIVEVAKLAGYKKRKDAPGSTARMYFQYLSRQRSHATRGMHTVYDLIEVNKQTKKERVLHEHFSTRADAKEAQDEYEGYKRSGVAYRIRSRQVPRPPLRYNRED